MKVGRLFFEAARDGGFVVTLGPNRESGRLTGAIRRELLAQGRCPDALSVNPHPRARGLRCKHNLHGCWRRTPLFDGRIPTPPRYRHKGAHDANEGEEKKNGRLLGLKLKE